MTFYFFYCSKRQAFSWFIRNLQILIDTEAIQVISTINNKFLAIILAAMNLTLLGCAYGSDEASLNGSIQAQSEPLNTSGALALSDLDEWLYYENFDYGLELYYPADWIEQEAEPNDQGMIVGFLAPGEDVDNPMVYLVLQNEELPAGQDVTLEEYSQDALGSLNEMPDLQILTESDITINEVPAHAIVYSLESEGVTFRVLNAWTVIDEYAYIFTYNAPDEVYDQFAGDVADIIDSFSADIFTRIPESSGLSEEAADNESLNETPKLMEDGNTSVVQ